MKKMTVSALLSAAVLSAAPEHLPVAVFLRIASVPEPASFAMLGAGLLIVGSIGHLRRKKK